MSLAGSLARTDDKVRKDTQKVFRNGERKPGKLGGMLDSASGIQKNVAGTVVGVGNIVASAAGALGATGLANMLTGSTSVSYQRRKEDSTYFGGLRGFYQQFSDTDGNGELAPIARVDPFATFECEFRFLPSIAAVQDVTKIQKTSTNGVNAVMDETGPSFQEEGSTVENSELVDDSDFGEKAKQSVIWRLLQQVKFKNSDFQTSTGDDMYVGSRIDTTTNETDELNVPYTKETTTVTQNVKRPITADLHLQLGIYIQKVALPNVQVEGGEESTTLVGKFPIPGNLVTPDNMNFSMDVVNVQSPVIENVFYPWMRETTFPWWSYDDQPFTTAEVTFDFTEHSNVKYHFFGCRPIHMQLVQPDQSPTPSVTRNIQFAFDFMTIETLEQKGDRYQKRGEVRTGGAKGGYGATDLANAALFSAANTLKL